jgi:hypothetical protein
VPELFIGGGVVVVLEHPEHPMNMPLGLHSYAIFNETAIFIPECYQFSPEKIVTESL